VYIKIIENSLKDRQGTFLHQARWAKVQERRQQETLVEIPKLVCDLKLENIKTIKFIIVKYYNLTI
jgi:hypothetical protein